MLFVHAFPRRLPSQIVTQRQHAANGFTVLELLNFLGLAAVISALAMYGVARYVRHSKTAEAVGSTTAIAQQATVYFNDSDAHQPAGTKPDSSHAMRHFPSSSRVSVPRLEDVKGKKYQSAIGDWSTSPWLDLHFSMTQPQCYAYSFEGTGSGVTAKATAIAQGDLDGNGVYSSYAATVSPDETLTAKVDAVIVKKDAEE